MEEITAALLAFNQRKQNVSEESQDEGLVVRGNLERGRRQGREGTAKGKFRSNPDLEKQCSVISTRIIGI